MFRNTARVHPFVVVLLFFTLRFFCHLSYLLAALAIFPTHLPVVASTKCVLTLVVAVRFVLGVIIVIQLVSVGHLPICLPRTDVFNAC